MEEKKEARPDARIKLNTENTAIANDIIAVTKEDVNVMAKRVLTKEFSRLEIDKFAPEDAEFLSRMDRIYDGVHSVVLSYAAEKSTIKETTEKDFSNQIDARNKTIAALTEKDSSSSATISKQDKEIKDLAAQIISLQKEIEMLKAENTRLLNNDALLQQIRERLDVQADATPIKKTTKKEST